ncbi:MAG: alpha/beta hydrolase [Pseudarcicella sp.]|nr:alpha/beta hydrolase [Pseudarcicella sp.]MBP6411558.1 alpha/beta hydrolase [Pseudarcicella sp.]
MEQKNIVLLHGFGENASIWQGYQKLLSIDYNVICPEYSQRNDFKSILEYADFVKQTLDLAGVKKCIVIGHSMGGYITMAFAEKYPEMLIGIGLFHTTVFGDTDERKIVRQKNIERLKQFGTEAFVESFVPNLYAPSFQIAHPDVIAAHKELASKISADALIAAQKAMISNPDRRDVLKKIQCRVLFIIGELDKNISPADAKSQIMIPKYFSSSILDNVAHMGMVEEADHCLAFIRKFIAGC